MTLEKAYEGNVTFGTPTDTAVNDKTDIGGQTFTVGTIGTDEGFSVTKVMINIKKTGSPTGNIKVQIRGTSSGTPTGEVLAEEELDISTITTSYDWYTISFTAPAVLAAATTYHLSFTGSDGTFDGSNYYSYQSNAANPYAGGDIYGSQDAGLTWTASSGTDMGFIIRGRVWTGTLCTYNDIIAKTGTDVGSELTTGNKIELLNNFVLQAEATLNMMTTYDWVANYSTSGTNYKQTLADCVSSMAAVNGIAYDMDGYGDRITAEDMINIHRDNILRLTNLLKQKVKQDKMNAV